MTLKEALKQLEALGTEKMRAQNAKNGAGDNQFGVRRGDVRARGLGGIGPALAAVLMVASCSEAPIPQFPELESWALGEPSVVIGARFEGPAALSPVQSLAIGPREEVHVLLPQVHEVRVFGDEGVFLGSIGAEGEGPGEFSRPAEIGFVGDTLWVLDTGARRISYFFEGEFLRVESFPSLEGLHPERSSRVAAVMAGPRLVVVTDSRDFFEPVETTTPGLLLTYGGGTFDTLATINVDHVGGWLVERNPGALPNVLTFSQPFDAASQWALSPKGFEVLVADGRSLTDGRGSFSVVRIDARGDTLSKALYPYEPIPIPEAVIDSAVAGIEAHGFPEEEIRESAFLPSTYPPVSGALFSQGGGAWIEREAIPGQDRRWHVTSEEGELLAEVLVPEGFQIRWVGEEAVWGLVLDELDVPYLIKRPILRNSAGPPDF